MPAETIAILFKTPAMVKAVAGYLGLVASVDKKLDRLLKSDFNAGTRCLGELLQATDDSSRTFLLRQAWNRFHSAISHETGERKALALLGLAMCQDRLEQSSIATNTLRELAEFEYTDTTEIVKRSALFTISGMGLPFVVASTAMVLRKAGILKVKGVPAKLLDNFESWMKIPSEEAVGRLANEAGLLVEIREAEQR